MEMKVVRAVEFFLNMLNIAFTGLLGREIDISYLRKKLSALKATVEIKARRNAGYSLEDKA